MPAFVDLTGKQYHRLTVVDLNQERSSKKRKLWNCICECGTKKVVDGENLKAGKTLSCGCWAKEIHPLIQEKRRKFTIEERAFRHIWQLMMRRCFNEKDAVYHHYGGRGISVCKEWQNYENFKRDMWPRPAGLSLERIDNNGNYELSNCKWASQLEQVNNRRSNKLMELDGEVKTVAEWSKIYNIQAAIVYQRLIRKWTLKDALTRPVRQFHGCSKSCQME
jgi:hypothetical protein